MKFLFGSYSEDTYSPRKASSVIRTGSLFFLAVVLSMSLFLSISYSDEPSLTMRSEIEKVGQGSEFTVEVEMLWKQSLQEGIVVVEITAPEAASLKLTDQKEITSSTLRSEGVFFRRSIKYTFVAEEKGSVEINPAVVEYVRINAPDDKIFIKTDSLTINVVSPFVILAGKLFFICGVLVAFCAVAGSIFLITRLIIKKRDQGKTQPVDFGAELEFLNKMKENERCRVFGEIKKYYSNMDEVLSGYLGVKYGIVLSGQYNYPVMDKLPDELKEIYRLWESLIEKVRFSGYVPDKDEQEKLIRKTRKYIESLIPEENPEENIETVD